MDNNVTNGERPRAHALGRQHRPARGIALDRNIDVEAASKAGVLVTHVGPSFVDAVTELTFGS